MDQFSNKLAHLDKEVSSQKGHIEHLDRSLSHLTTLFERSHNELSTKINDLVKVIASNEKTDWKTVFAGISTLLVIGGLILANVDQKIAYTREILELKSKLNTEKVQALSHLVDRNTGELDVIRGNTFSLTDYARHLDRYHPFPSREKTSDPAQPSDH